MDPSDLPRQQALTGELDMGWRLRASDPRLACARAEAVLRKLDGREDDAPLRAEASALLGAALVALGDMPGAAELLRRSEEPGSMPPSRGRLLGRLSLAIAEHRLSRTAVCEDLLRLVDGSGDLVVEAEVLLVRGMLLVEGGRIPEAFQRLHQAERLFGEMEDLFGLARTHIVFGNAYTHLDRHATAIEHFEAAGDAYTRLGNRKGRALVKGSLAMSHERLGHWMEALGFAEAALEGFLDCGARQHAALMLHNVGDLQIRLGHHGRAIATLQRALREAMDLRLGHSLTVVRLALARAHAALGAYVESADLFRVALAGARAGTDVWALTSALRSLAEVQLAHGRPEDFSRLPTVLEALQEAVLVARAAGLQQALREALALLAPELEAAGQPSEALAALREHARLQEAFHEERLRRQEQTREAEDLLRAARAETVVAQARVSELGEALDETRGALEKSRLLARERSAGVQQLLSALRADLCAIEMGLDYLGSGSLGTAQKAVLEEVRARLATGRRRLQAQSDAEATDPARLGSEVETIDLMTQLSEAVARSSAARGSEQGTSLSGPGLLPVYASAEALGWLLEICLRRATAAEAQRQGTNAEVRFTTPLAEAPAEAVSLARSLGGTLESAPGGLLILRLRAVPD